MRLAGTGFPAGWRQAIAFVACGVLAALLLAPTPLRHSSAHAQPAPLRVPLPEGVHINQVVVSPDGEHVAFVRKTDDDQQCVVLDGDAQPAHAVIRAPWQALRRSCLPEFSPGLFFSPDGTRLAYAVAIGKQWAMVIDGKPGRAYDDLDLPVFSPDSRRVAYAAKTGNTWRLVADGKESTAFTGIGVGRGYAGDPTTIDPVFSPDSVHLAYTGFRVTDHQHTQYVIVDGKEFGPYSRVFGFSFAADSKRYAFAATSPTGAGVMVNGTASETYAQVGAPVFSPDGARVAFPALVKERDWRLIVDGKEAAAGNSFSSPVFSPDGKRLACVSKGKEGQDLLWVDGKVIAESTRVIRDILFSPDSQRVACIRDYAHGCGVSIDGANLPGELARYEVIFSPDSHHLAYIARLGGQQAVMIDGKPLPATNGSIFALDFTPDGHHLIYGVISRDQPRMQLAIDGVLDDTYQTILPFPIDRGPCFFFTAPDRIHFFALQEGQLRRIELTLPTGQAAWDTDATIPPNAHETLRSVIGALAH